jgi:hypothetical protein
MAPAPKKATMTSNASLPLGRRQAPFRKTALIPGNPHHIFSIMLKTQKNVKRQSG